MRVLFRILSPLLTVLSWWVRWDLETIYGGATFKSPHFELFYFGLAFFPLPDSSNSEFAARYRPEAPDCERNQYENESEKKEKAACFRLEFFALNLRPRSPSHKGRLSRLQKWILLAYVRKVLMNDNSFLTLARGMKRRLEEDEKYRETYWKYLFRDEILKHYYGVVADGEWQCSCPVWKFRRKECKHVLLVQSYYRAQPPPKMLQVKPSKPRPRRPAPPPPPSRRGRDVEEVGALLAQAFQVKEIQIDDW